MSDSKNSPQGFLKTISGMREGPLRSLYVTSVRCANKIGMLIKQPYLNVSPKGPENEKNLAGKFIDKNLMS